MDISLFRHSFLQFVCFHDEYIFASGFFLLNQKITPLKPFLTKAPALVVVASLTSAPYWLESTWISIAYILLSVENHKLGTLTYTPGETKFLNRLLNIPSQYLPIVILPIGYPAENPSSKTRSRKSLRKTCYLNGYGQQDPFLR